METNYKVYPSGLRLAVCTKPDSRAVSFFVGVNAGCVNEDEHNNGISHLIEHMVFKGSTNRTKEQIAEELEGIGAISNAFTSEQNTCFYAQCIDEQLEKSVEILSDVFLNPKFDPKELANEKKVVFEEINMYEDDPDTVAAEAFMGEFFKGHALSRKILGTKEVLSALTNREMFEYMSRFYTPDNTVISFAGGVTFAEAQRLVQKFFGKFLNAKSMPPREIFDTEAIMIPKPSFVGIKKDIQQCHITAGFAIPNIQNNLKTVVKVLSIIFGGGMSSRLFKILRNKYGYVYHINSMPELFTAGGALAITFGTTAENQANAIKEIKQIIDTLADGGITQAELDKAKNLLKSITIMSEETNLGLARGNALSLLNLNKLESQQEKIRQINDVKLDIANKTVKKYFSAKNMCAAVVASEPDLKIFEPFKSDK